MNWVETTCLRLNLKRFSSFLLVLQYCHQEIIYMFFYRLLKLYFSSNCRIVCLVTELIYWMVKPYLLLWKKSWQMLKDAETNTYVHFISKSSRTTVGNLLKHSFNSFFFFSMNKRNILASAIYNRLQMGVKVAIFLKISLWKWYVGTWEKAKLDFARFVLEQEAMMRNHMPSR